MHVFVKNIRKWLLSYMALDVYTNHLLQNKCDLKQNWIWRNQTSQLFSMQIIIPNIISFVFVGITIQLPMTALKVGLQCMMLNAIKDSMFF